MPLYDCGDKYCDECQRAFGPNREKAIRIYEAREVYYASLQMGTELAPLLSPPDHNVPKNRG